MALWWKAFGSGQAGHGFRTVPVVRATILTFGLLAGATLAGCSTPTPSTPTAASIETTATVAASSTDVPPTEIPVATPAPSETRAPATPTTASTPSPATSVPSASATAIPTPRGTLAPIGVMIDNDPSARPQTGFNAADVVYEVIAEFDLTRFLAIYLANAPTNVGSIRSTRPYFALAMTDYGGGLVHCLDVPGVTDILDRGTIFNFDLCRGEGQEAATRISSRVAPFNLYVDAHMLQGELNLHPARSAPALLARQPLAADQQSATHIEIDHPDPHVITWDWNGKVYLRQQDGKPHLEANGDQVSTDVIVIQQAEEEPTRFFGEAGYHTVGLTGSGDGTVLAGGRSAPIHWSRTGVTAPTVLTGLRGGPFLLPPGRVFFEVVSPDAPVKLKN
jgi:hypothetical protein